MWVVLLLPSQISTHTPVKGVTAYPWFVIWFTNNFNSHAREGRDELLADLKNSFLYFNSHAREGRDNVTCDIIITDVNFNSHAREGRDGL